MIQARNMPDVDTDPLAPHAAYDRHADRWGLQFGMTPVSAEQLLRREFPEVSQWMCWIAGTDPADRALQGIVGEGMQREGSFGGWAWARVPCSYGGVGFWSGSRKRASGGVGWTGMLRITSPEGAEFMMFSYLRVDLKLNTEYLVSTGDLNLLRSFADATRKFLRPRRNAEIANVAVINSMHDFTLKTKEMEQVYLPHELQSDIVTQVDGFFGGRKTYKALGIPFKRGFLFTGLPGTGKTMLIRNIIRHCHRKHRISTAYLSINRRTDADDLRTLFNVASEKRPALIILEDIESLCHEASITRSEVLAELDGINQRSGMLLIATANNPSKIDPALVHRPSRFDRVWAFPLPDKALRHRYISEQFKGIDPQLAMHIADHTDDWTFAYIKELRNTAGILAIKDGLKIIGSIHYEKALDLLKAQHKAGKTGHSETANKRTKVGFEPASSMKEAGFCESA